MTNPVSNNAATHLHFINLAQVSESLGGLFFFWQKEAVCVLKRNTLETISELFSLPTFKTQRKEYIERISERLPVSNCLEGKVILKKIGNTHMQIFTNLNRLCSQVCLAALARVVVRYCSLTVYITVKGYGSPRWENGYVHRCSEVSPIILRTCGKPMRLMC